nr:E3 ubiquitin-protein ligase At1g63170 [Tanacetum cinerariifolium]
GGSEKTIEGYMENYKNVSQDIRDQLNAEAEEHRNEVSEIQAERLTRTANPLALVSQQQPVYHPTHYTNNFSTKSQQAATRNRRKAIVNSSPSTYDQEPTMVAENNEMSKEKKIDKLMALISLSFKKIYKHTNNNLKTSSNTNRSNQDNTLRINRGTRYDNHRVVNVDEAKENVGTQVVQQSEIQCYNCKEYGHVAKECQKPKRAKDAAYHKEKMLLLKVPVEYFKMSLDCFFVVWFDVGNVWIFGGQIVADAPNLYSKDRPPMLAPDNDIYSTVDACPNACEMWKATERLIHGKSINVQDLKTNLYREFGKFTPRDGGRIPRKGQNRIKTEKNGKHGEAGKSQKQLQSVEEEKLKKMQKEGSEMQTHASFNKERREQGLDLKFIESYKGKSGATTVLASGAAEVPTSSGSIPTVGPPAAEVPTGSDVVPTTSLVFSTVDIDAQVARELEEQLKREDQRRNNETIAKYLQEYHQFASDLPIERRIELISDLVKYQDNYAMIYKFQNQQRKPWTKKQKRDYYMVVIRKEVTEEAKSSDEVPEEKVKEMMQLVPIEERLVKETLNNRPPTGDKEMELWVELSRLYELDDEDQLWTHTQNLMHALIEWKLYDSCEVHHVTSKDKEIFMLVEKDYPLRKGLALEMISYKLQVENYSRMANDLLLKIYKIASTPRQQGD